VTEAERQRALLEFWFGAPGAPEHDQPRKLWFERNDAFDAGLRERFGADHARACAGGCDGWAETADGALALVLLLDQLSRNLHRGQPEAFANDAHARDVVRHALERGFDQAVAPVRRLFFYMPLMHSEELADQERSIALIAALPAGPGRDSNLASARQHRDIVARFGRFPHRNLVLGRPSTPAETAFLATPVP
jgi:uncharacterized protein (DUF924 family)